MYEELNQLTNGKCTFEQFEMLNQLYMSSEPMSKEDCAKVWDITYGKYIEEDLFHKRMVLAISEQVNAHYDQLDYLVSCYQSIGNGQFKSTIKIDGVDYEIIYDSRMEYYSIYHPVHQRRYSFILRR